MNFTCPTNSPSRPERLPLPTTKYIIVPTLILSFIVAVRPRLPVRFAVVLLHTLWIVDGTKSSGGGGYEDYLLGAFLGATSLMAFYLLILTDPMLNWRHSSQPDVRPCQLPLWERIYWVLCSAFNNRGLGWSFQVPYVPFLPSDTRWAFMKRRTFQLLWSLLLVDIAQTYERTNPIFSSKNTSSMWSQGLLWGHVNLLARLIVAWGMFNIPYNFLSLACVGTGMQKPEDWPDTFGTWSDAYTIRRFWSRCWHQRLRRYTAETGGSAARFLHCKPGTWLSARVQLIFGFGISALAHLPGDLMVDPRCAGSSAPFFLWQIVAITFEDFVIDVGRRHGVKDGLWARAVGWTWTAGWLVMLTARFVEWTFPVGAGMHEVMRFSLVRPLLKYVVRILEVN